MKTLPKYNKYIAKIKPVIIHCKEEFINTLIAANVQHVLITKDIN